MRKVATKHVEWLKKELPILKTEGLISAIENHNIERYYAEKTEGGLSWAIVAFSILGSILIGAGIILLFAHNWDQFSRPTRSVLSFGPVLLAGALSLIALVKNGGVAFRESAGIFQCLAVGASIALIGQTYNIPSDTPAFMLTWSLLILPLMFLLSSTGALMIYLALICFWSGFSQEVHGQAAGFWLLILPALGKTVAMIRVRRNSPDTLVSVFGILIALTIATGIVFERTVPGLWIVAYSALLSGAALLGLHFYGNEDGWNNPLKMVGTIGIALLAYLFTWTDLWNDIGWHHLHSGWQFKSWGIGLDIGVTIGYLLVWIIVAFKAYRRESIETIVLAIFPIIGIVCFVLGSVFGNSSNLWTALIFNGFMLFFGVMYIVMGCRNLRLRQLNGGMAIISLLLITRFFDQDFGFLARGLVFNILGISFLAVNLVMAKRKKKMGAHS